MVYNMKQSIVKETIISKADNDFVKKLGKSGKKIGQFKQSIAILNVQNTSLNRRTKNL